MNQIYQISHSMLDLSQKTEKGIQTSHRGKKEWIKTN